MIDLKELKRLAEGATQGEWEYTGNNGVDYECSECGEEFPESGYAVKSKDEHQVLECHLYGMERFCKPDGEYIASANPSTILQLIKEHQEMREALESISSKNKPRHDDAKYWQAISREQCAEVLANDTRIARQALDGVSK